MNAFLDRFFLLRQTPDPAWSRRRLAVYLTYRGVMLLCAGLCMGMVLLILAAGPYDNEIIPSYFQHLDLLLLNSLPVALLTLFFYGLFGRAWAAFLAGGGIFFGFALGNYYKLHFRDDPLYLEDLLILREAKAMAGGDHYNLFFTKKILVVFSLLLLGTLLLFFLVRGRVTGWRRRTAAAASALLVSAALTPLYLSKDCYNSLQNYEYLNKLSPTQSYIAHGCVYPFLHSFSDFVEFPPRGYNKADAAALLAQYEDADIPSDKKVNVIAIMREAYVDFSQYNIAGLDDSCYDPYHALEAESLSGDLLTNIFAGGTIDTERGFLTGNYLLHNFRSNTNSYVWYLRNQGYTVEGSHPYYQWFYNRQNVNAYMGFERYRYLEWDYEYFTERYMPEDAILYPEVYKDFIKNKETGKPYFSFVVNVESHGPYDTRSNWAGIEYLTGSQYSNACKNAMNNYMAAIMRGDRDLLAMVDKLREDPEPVVMVLFSDHLPWMGDGNIFYEEMGIPVEPEGEQGFRLHYTTRYLLWANDAAKAVLGSDFTGEGPTISPCYLMNLLFEQCGWEGPAFMQAMEDYRAVFPVVTTNDAYVVDGVFTDEIPQERKELFQDFLCLQHYWRNEFIQESVE